MMSDGFIISSICVTNVNYAVDDDTMDLIVRDIHYDGGTCVVGIDMTNNSLIIELTKKQCLVMIEAMQVIADRYPEG